MDSVGQTRKSASHERSKSMSEYDRNKGVEKPMLVYSEVTERIYIAYKNELIDVTEQAKQIVKALEVEHDS